MAARKRKPRVLAWWLQPASPGPGKRWRGTKKVALQARWVTPWALRIEMVVK